MNKEKLDKLVSSHTSQLLELKDGDFLTYTDIEVALKRGANWLMRQPLSERLTDEEKEKIRQIYIDNSPMTNWVNVDKKVSICVLQLLESIFGPELFKEKQL